jgi:NDP-sugar pyrophosphorylase family protein
MVLDGRIFSYAVEEDSKSGEYYIPHALNRFARDASVAVVRTDFWMPIGRPEDIASVEASGVLCEH